MSNSAGMKDRKTGNMCIFMFVQDNLCAC